MAHKEGSESSICLVGVMDSKEIICAPLVFVAVRLLYLQAQMTPLKSLLPAGAQKEWQLNNKKSLDCVR
jgi:hypothetical protein